MQLLFEDEGDLKVGAVLSSTDSSFQVELPGGRRSKVKAANVLLRFERPAGAQLLEQARQEAAGVDLDFLWQCAPQQEFGFHDLARDYFGHEPSAVEAAAILMRVHGAPVYFHRKAKGRFRPAPPDVLKAALAAVAKRRALEEQRARDVAELMDGGLPDSIRALGAGLLLRPDRSSPQFKAVEQAAHQLKTTALRLLLSRGSIVSPYAWHLESFLARSFPRGTGFDPSLPAPDVPGGSLPLAPAQAFSIDDAATTEIDDAFSVARAPDGAVRVGIHIAAPAVAIARGGPLDALAGTRLSTVYAPGLKITMLPPAWIAAFSLDAGRTVPCLSLYIDLAPAAAADGAEAGLAPRTCTTVLERIHVAANLRHDELAPRVSPELLSAPEAASQLPFGEELSILWRLSQVLLARRESARGRPETPGRVDYSFEMDGEGEQARVNIKPRQRDAPLDRLVAELMIFANSHWGRWMVEKNVAGVYRSQAGGRVRMATTPGPHEGLGVEHYAWSTSPLRRYVDLVNQRQLVAAVRGETAPFERGDAELFAVVSAFDAAYGAYADFQALMERYWCLRWIEQNRLARTRAAVLRDDLLRVEGLPLVVRVPGLSGLPRGRCVELDLLGSDLLELSLQARVHRVLELASAELPDEEETLPDPERFADPVPPVETAPEVQASGSA